MPIKPPASPPDTRRTTPVRLCDLPTEVRMTGAREACRVEADPDEKLSILAAALAPSRNVYWVAA